MISLFGKPSADKAKAQLRVGDLVLIKHRGQYGHIIDISNGRYMVRFDGGKRVESYSASELTRA